MKKRFMSIVLAAALMLTIQTVRFDLPEAVTGGETGIKVLVEPSMEHIFSSWGSMRKFNGGSAIVSNPDNMNLGGAIIDKHGNITVPFGAYDNIIDIHDYDYSTETEEFCNLFRVAKGDKLGIIDPYGKIIVPLGKYDAFGSLFFGGMMHVEKWDEDNLMISKFGMIDRTGQERVSLGRFDSIGDFDSGRAWVSKGGQQAVIDRNGNVIVPFGRYEPIYGAIDFGYVGRQFHQGFSVVQERVAREQGSVRYRYIDVNGREITSLFLRHASRFSGGTAVVAVTEFLGIIDNMWTFKDKFAVIDTTGKVVVPFETYDRMKKLKNGMIVVYKDGLRGLISSTGSVILPLGEYWDSFIREDGILYTNWGWECDYFNEAGKLIVSSPSSDGYKSLSLFSDGVAWLYYATGEEYAVVDMTGKVIVERGVYNPIHWDRTFDGGVRFYCGVSWVEKDGKYGIIDTKGKLIFPYTDYDKVHPFNDGIALVEKDGLYGILEVVDEYIHYDEPSVTTVTTTPPTTAATTPPTTTSPTTTTAATTTPPTTTTATTTTTTHKSGENTTNLADLFRHDSSAYNNDLAIFAAELSEAAYGEAPFAVLDGSVITKKLTDLGFSGFLQENYRANNPKVGFTIASRKITVDNSVKNLIAVTIRGTPPPKQSLGWGEWLNNALGIDPAGLSSVGFNKDKVHIGFKAAADDLYRYFKEYMKAFPDKSDNVLLITGHSRGGSVANLFTAELNKNSNYASKNRTYTYTFAAPNSTRVPIKDTTTNNIINVINKNDIVPKVPDNLGVAESRWGRHGVDLAVTMPDVAGAHNMKTYIACLKKENLIVQIYEEGLDGENNSIWTEDIWAKMLRAKLLLYWKCPVDIEISDSNGNVVATITNGVASNSNDSNVVVFVLNGVKHAFLPTDDIYTAKAIATDDGMLTFTVEMVVDTTDEPLPFGIKTFENVALTKGKEFVSEIGGAADVRLFIAKDGAIVAEVATDGTERALTAACTVCPICKSGQPPKPGHILGNTTVGTSDALEILKYIVKLPTPINSCNNARKAATIMGDTITTADALEILKHIVKLPNKIDGTA